MAKKTINNVDDVKRVYEDESLLREMYNDDVERVKNGEEAIFFGHLNDKPLENVYPEYEILGPSYLKLLRGLKAPSVYKVDPSSLRITGGDIANGAFDVARGILNLPRTIGDIFRRTGKGVGNMLGDGPASKIWKASIGKWMTYLGKYPERVPAFIDASKGMSGEDDITSFSDAFSDADKKGLDEFEWKGKRYKVEKKKEGGETKPSRRRIDWDKFKEAYGNMKRKGAGHARKIDTEGLDYLYDALYRNNFTERQIEAIIGNVIEESGGDPFAKAKGSQYKGLFQESNIRYPVSEFEADKKRFEGKKKEYIDYMVDRFNKHVRDAKYYSVKGTKYKKAQEAVDEFFSTETGIDYSYPLVYAFEAPGDKEGTYKNRKLVSDIISKSYADDGLYEPDVTANKVEPKQDVNNNGFGAAFKEAKRKGLNEFVFNGKRYSTAVKEDGGSISNDVAYTKDGWDAGNVLRRDNTNVSNLHPEIILSEEIGENIPYEAGSLPEVVIKSGLTGKNLERALNLADARRGRSYVYKSQNEIMDPILETVNNPAVQLGLSFAPIVGSAMDIQDLMESIKEGRPEAIALASVGLIPWVGDLTKDVSKVQRMKSSKGLSGREALKADYDALAKFKKRTSDSKLPPFGEIKSGEQLDELFKKEIERHRTVVRGVVADEADAEKYLFTLAPERTKAGRYGVRDDMSSNKSGYLYTSNSYDQALGYATNPVLYNGENGYIGRMMIGPEIDYTSKDRLDWLKQADFDFDIADLSVSREARDNIYGNYEKIFGPIRSLSPERLKKIRNYLLERSGRKNEYSVDEYRNLLRETRKKYENYKSEYKKTQNSLYKSLMNSEKDYLEYIQSFEDVAKSAKEGDKIKIANSRAFELTGRRVMMSNENRMNKIDNIINRYIEDKYTTNPQKGIILGGVGEPGQNLMHFIITDKNLIHPLSVDRVVGENPEMYTRQHNAYSSNDLTGKIFKDGGSVSEGETKWWEDEKKREVVVERQDSARIAQKNFIKLEENARKALEDGDIDESEYRNIIGFAGSLIGSLVVENTGKGEEVAGMINQILDSGINEEAFGKGIEDASNGKSEQRMEDLHDYKLMANSLLTLADIATASPGVLRILGKVGVNLKPILKTIANNKKIQIASGMLGMGVDGSQIAINPDEDNTMNYAGIIGAAAEVIGGTDVMRRSRMMRQYGDKIDDVLDVANPIITIGGVASDLFFEDGGDVKQKQKKAYDYFTMKRGMSQIQALAILGNLMAESGLKDDISGDNGTSYGIQQWHNERKDALFKKARKNGHDTPTFEDQLEFLADEYEGKTGYSNFLYARRGKMGPGYYNYSRSDFQDAENLRDAVVAWNQGAGRPHKSVIRNNDRYSAALKVAKNLGFDFGLDAGAAPMYGQMGIGEDFIFHEENEEPTGDAQPVSDTQAVSPQDTSPTTQEDMMKNWIEAYGKGIVAQLMATRGNNKVNASVDDTTERYRDYVRESKDDEDSKRMALLQSFLPNIQLKIKGVTQVRGGQ